VVQVCDVKVENKILHTCEREFSRDIPISNECHSNFELYDIIEEVEMTNLLHGNVLTLKHKANNKTELIPKDTCIYTSMLWGVCRVFPPFVCVCCTVCYKKLILNLSIK